MQESTSEEIRQNLDITSILLVLTTECNLRCSYCFQTAKKTRTMSVKTMYDTLDFALNSNDKDLAIFFYGGEPFLEWETIREAVAYCSPPSNHDKNIRYAVTTNGMLLTEDVLEYLDLHEFQLTISFDGIPEAQAFRDRSTFPFLDRLIDRLRIRHRDYFRKKVQIGITLIPSTIPYLADSIDYFLQKGVQTITITPAFTFRPDWSDEHFAILEGQMERVGETTQSHYSRTGTIPVSIFRHVPNQISVGTREIDMCGILRAHGYAVDTDGSFHACGLVLNAPNNRSSELLKLCQEAMRIGTLDDPSFHIRYQSLGERCKEVGIFDKKEQKSSSYGRCSECEFLSSCFVCPLAIAHNQTERNPDIIPDFHCAFNRITLKYRKLFPERPNIIDALRSAYDG